MAALELLGCAEESRDELLLSLFSRNGHVRLATAFFRDWCNSSISRRLGTQHFGDNDDDDENVTPNRTTMKRSSGTSSSKGPRKRLRLDPPAKIQLSLSLQSPRSVLSMITSTTNSGEALF